MTKTLLVFAPHPDDAEFFAGGTLARRIQEGWKVVIVTATDGRCGSFVQDSSSLAQLRAGEARQAAAVLGAEPPILLGHPDMELDRLPPGQLREQFIRVLRQLRPEAVIAEDVQAFQEVHPDHRAVAWAAAEALSYAHLPLVHPEHIQAGLQPHFVTEKYFYAGAPKTQNKFVDITETLSLKLAALAAHQTQITFLVEELFKQARYAGLDLEAILGPAAADPLVAFQMAIQSEAAATGARAGVQYAEAFRYARYHPLIENMLTVTEAS